jgi:Peptidase U49
MIRRQAKERPNINGVLASTAHAKVRTSQIVGEDLVQHQSSKLDRGNFTMRAPGKPEPEEIPMDVVDDIRRILHDVAPERAEELQEIVTRRGISILVENRQHESPFTANPRENIIRAYFPALVRQTVMAFAYVRAFRAREREGDISARRFMPQGSPEMERAQDMLRWAMFDRYLADRAKAYGREPAPQTPPDQWMCPDPTTGEDSNDRIAIELFYMALGADLHHELAHVRMNHGSPELRNEQLRQQEAEADAESLRWLVGGIPQDAPEYPKRAMGLALAQLYEIFMRLEGSREDDSHPPMSRRLGDTIRICVQEDDHLVWAFVSASLILHLETANRPQHYDRDRVFPTFRGLAEYLMHVFETR